MLFKRRKFTQNEIRSHFDTENLSIQWGKLYKQAPNFMGMVWQANQSELCAAKAQEKNWSADTCHIRLVEGLTTFHWALGGRITKELVEIGQNPVLCALMDIKEPLLNERLEGDLVDLQAVLLLVATRAVADFQQFEERSLFMIRLLHELELDRGLFEEVCEAAVRVDLVNRETIKRSRGYVY